MYAPTSTRRRAMWAAARPTHMYASRVDVGSGFGYRHRPTCVRFRQRHARRIVYQRQSRPRAGQQVAGNTTSSFACLEKGSSKNGFRRPRSRPEVQFSLRARLEKDPGFQNFPLRGNQRGLRRKRDAESFDCKGGARRSGVFCRKNAPAAQIFIFFKKSFSVK